MNLQQVVPRELWRAVESNYASQDYAQAIVSAFLHLSTLLRDRAGVDGDGAQLVGLALGGRVPKLKLSKLESESDRSMQAGYVQILNGLYMGIRNPRSHSPRSDEKRTADAVIHFLGHIVELVGSSQETYSDSNFLAVVRDPDFVASEEYATLLVDEIPALRRLDAIRALLAERDGLPLSERRHLIVALHTGLNEVQRVTFVEDVERVLREPGLGDSDVRAALLMLTPELWPHLNRRVRLKLETRLIKGIVEGNSVSGRVTGALATWSHRFLHAFEQCDEVADAVVSKLERGTRSEVEYVVRFFMADLPQFVRSRSLQLRCAGAIARQVESGNEELRAALLSWVPRYPPEWQTLLATRLRKFTNDSHPGARLDGGIPFLSAPTGEFADDDDIPF